MKSTVLFVLAFVSFFEAFSQAEDEKSLKISGFSMQTGTYYLHDNYGGTLERFKELVPESDLLDKNFDDFNQYFNEGDPNYSSAFSVQLAFDWLNKGENWSQLNPQLRLGFSYGNINLISGSLDKTDYFRIDTLVSNSSGKEYYVDSVDSDNYTLNYDADFLVLDASLIIGSNPMNRWSIYGGVGFSAGFNFNAKARVFFSNDRYFDSNANYNSTRYQWDPEYKEEVFSNKEAGVVLMMSMPLGINFRLSKDKRIWENFSLFLESRPSITYFSVSGIDDNLYTASFNSFGLKYRFLD